MFQIAAAQMGLTGIFLLFLDIVHQMKVATRHILLDMKEKIIIFGNMF